MILWLLALLRLFLFEGEGNGDGDENDGDPPDDEDEEPDPDKKRPRDPEKQKLIDEARKWRLKFREAEAKLKDVGDQEPIRDALRTARLELSFLRTAMEHDDPIADLETAWDLGTARGYFDTVKIEDDGTVAGMDEALDRLLERYPYLIDSDDDEEPEPPVSRPSPRPIGQGRKAGAAVGDASLEKRFPLLAKRRRGHR
jgi:hypothetical protein